MELDSRHIPTRRYFGGLVSVVLVLVMVLSAIPQSSASAVTCKFKHTVEPGETLIYLGDLYQIGWMKIASANKITAPYTITAGMVLCIPEGSTKPSTGTTTTSTGKKNEPVLSVQPEVGHILVAVENFAKKTSYNVRIFSNDWSVSYRLGWFTTNKEGDYTGYFKVPPYVPRTNNMALCVKNMWSDATSCVKYSDLWAIVPEYYNNPTCAVIRRR